mmetsp:Transcript_10028/g.24804  ORF Transcript_10028/g.24804 Transcript_10028/m.24804 type:complete len:676 (+) Transcript_10028:78-2105(+)
MCTRENHLNLQLSAAEIAKLTDDIIAKTTACLDGVVAVTGDRTFENTIAPMAKMEREISPIVSSCDFPMHVSSNSELRDASSESDEKLRKFNVDCSMRVDVYEAVQAYEEQRKARGEKLGAEAERLVSRMLRDYRRNGLALDKEKRDKVGDLKKQLSEKEVQFQKNLNEDKTRHAFAKEELEGMNEDYIGSLEDAEGGKKWVTLKYPDILPLMQKAKREETRKIMDKLKGSQCADVNTPLLEDALKIRSELAQLLSYKDHASYVLEERMAKNTSTALTLLSDLKDKLAPFADRELEALKKLKEEEKKERGEPFDGKINSWDFQYYHTLIKERTYSVDEDTVREYFPLEIVKEGLLQAYQQILTLTFTKVSDPKGLWHEDVEQYEVSDSATKDFMGYFYLDLHPREGKYGHAAVFGLQAACDKEPTSGVEAEKAVPRQCSIAAMVANFTKPTADKPSLLKHGEVVTFFHEFGHVMHQVCTKAKFCEFSGTRTERDFVEAPSQMLENWCWEEEPLTKMSGHYLDKSKPLEIELLRNMIRAKNLNSGLLNLRQAFFGSFDLSIHMTSDRVDTGKVWSELREEITRIPNSSGGNGAASFGHIMGGYDSGYYGYLWSEVFSADMFTIFKSSGDLYSPVIGARYRQKILEPGGTVDGDEMVRGFLGRELDKSAFLVSNGLQ